MVLSQVGSFKNVHFEAIILKQKWMIATQINLCFIEWL